MNIWVIDLLHLYLIFSEGSQGGIYRIHRLSFIQSLTHLSFSNVFCFQAIFWNNIQMYLWSFFPQRTCWNGYHFQTKESIRECKNASSLPQRCLRWGRGQRKREWHVWMDGWIVCHHKVMRMCIYKHMQTSSAFQDKRERMTKLAVLLRHLWGMIEHEILWRLKLVVCHICKLCFLNNE